MCEKQNKQTDKRKKERPEKTGTTALLWGENMCETVVSTPQTYDTVDGAQAVGAATTRGFAQWVTCRITPFCCLFVLFLTTCE